MSGPVSVLDAARAVVLAGGFAYAAVEDVRSREVADGLWQLLGAVALVLGGVAVWSYGLLPTVLWVVAGAFALEHLVPWDDALGERYQKAVPGIELAAYAAVLSVVGVAVYRWGIGPATVPVPVIAAVASVVLARVLFELGVLYGGADAKALIVAGVLVPVFGAPLLYAPALTAPLLAVLPFSLTLLTNAALVSIAVPVAIAVRNLVRGEFSFPRGFTGYTIPVDDLPRRYVWVRDAAVGQDTLVDDAETSEEDVRKRAAIARELKAKGVSRVWVSPQLPFVVLMTAGAFAGLLAGNLLIDLFAVL